MPPRAPMAFHLCRQSVDMHHCLQRVRPFSATSILPLPAHLGHRSQGLAAWSTKGCIAPPPPPRPRVALTTRSMAMCGGLLLSFMCGGVPSRRGSPGRLHVPYVRLRLCFFLWLAVPCCCARRVRIGRWSRIGPSGWPTEITPSGKIERAPRQSGAMRAHLPHSVASLDLVLRAVAGEVRV